MKHTTLVLAALLVCGVEFPAAADPLRCDLSKYKAGAVPSATIVDDLLVVAWRGDRGTEVRVRYAIESGQPQIRDLSVRKSPGGWTTIGERLKPEYHVVSGVRRMTTQQASPLRDAGIELTQQVIDKNRWYAFWDAPLFIPGPPPPAQPGGKPARQPTPRVLGGPRTPNEIRRASASFNTTSCTVATEGIGLEVTFPGLSMGIFSGDLRFTAYRGTNLIRMEAMASTREEWVAYKYDAGLSGFTTSLTPRVTWRDTGGHAQQYSFGSVKNDTIVPLKAANRLLVAEGKGASIAVFPPPHTFFFTREVDTNLGYVWYRKDQTDRFAFGIRQAEAEEAPEYVENFALFNAPPGSLQRMAVYFYPSADTAAAARESALAFTHNDTFKPVPGYKTMVNHFHLRFTDRVRSSGSFDTPVQDIAAMKALGLNIVGLSDFHGDLHPNDPGPVRFKDQKDYREATRRASDADFLVAPWEEPSAYFGGHYNILFPKTVYWSKVRQPGQPFIEQDPVYGTVYHTGSAEDVQKMMDAEGAYWYHAHPRTKGTTGYPDLMFEKPWTKDDRYLGVAFKPGMGMDLSESRLCEWRCFDAADTMNNLYADAGVKPKYIIADIDTYRKGPEDDLYPNFPVNYLKLDKVPGPDADWSPVLGALRRGDFFVTTGEILIKSYRVDGTGPRRTIAADVEWTFPLSFVEVVWGDGKKIDRQVISATDLPAFGTKRFSIPFDAAGKAWVRFAVWDTAGNGAFVQPVWLRTERESSEPSRVRDAFLRVIARPRVPLSPEVRVQTSDGGIVREHFTFASQQGERVPGVLLKPSGESARRPAVILLHGTGGSKSDARIRTLSEALVSRGFVAVAIDGRYHGERTRAGARATEYVAAIREAYRSQNEHPFLYDTVWDIMRLIDYLETREDVDRSRIGVTGISKGGMETYLAAAVDPRIAAAVPVIGVQSFRWALDHDAWQSRAGTFQAALDSAASDEGVKTVDAAFVRRFYDRVVPGIYSEFDAPAMLPLVAPRPLLVINGDSDARTPLAGVQESAAAAERAYRAAHARERFVLHIQPDTGHAFTPRAEQAALDWFVRWLKP